MDFIDDLQKVPAKLSREQNLVASKIEDKGHHGGSLRYLPRPKTHPPPSDQQEEEAPPPTPHLIDVVV